MSNKSEKQLPYVTPTNNLREFIQQVCLRPSMHVGVHRFDLAVAYIDGYYHALVFLRSEETKSGELRDFSSWLAERHNLPRNWTWGSLMQKAYPNDEFAFEQLPLLYEEFINQRR